MIDMIEIDMIEEIEEIKEDLDHMKEGKKILEEDIDLIAAHLHLLIILAFQENIENKRKDHIAASRNHQNHPDLLVDKYYYNENYYNTNMSCCFITN